MPPRISAWNYHIRCDCQVNGFDRCAKIAGNSVYGWVIDETAERREHARKSSQKNFPSFLSLSKDWVATVIFGCTVPWVAGLGLFRSHWEWLNRGIQGRSFHAFFLMPRGRRKSCKNSGSSRDDRNQRWWNHWLCNWFIHVARSYAEIIWARGRSCTAACY